MAPGITYLPATSMVSSAVTPLAARPPPICAIVSPSTRTSASYEPSAVTTVPLAIRVRMLPPRAWPAARRPAGGGPLGGHRSEAERAARPTAARRRPGVTTEPVRSERSRASRAAAPPAPTCIHQTNPAQADRGQRGQEGDGGDEPVAAALGPGRGTVHLPERITTTKQGQRRHRILQHLASGGCRGRASESDLRPPDPRPDPSRTAPGPHRSDRGRGRRFRRPLVVPRMHR